MARRPGAGRRPGAADVARVRALRAGPRRDGRPGGGAGGVAGRLGEGARRQRPGAAPGHARARRTCPRRSGRSGPGPASAWSRSLAELFDRGYTPVLEVAGRGEFARRGGIVDVFPPSAPLPVRIEFFGDEIDSLRAFDPTDQRTVGPVDEVALLPATEFLLPDGGADAIRARLGPARGAAPGAPRAGPGAVRGRGARPSGPRRSRRDAPCPRATRRRSGRGSSPRPPASTTSTPPRCSSSTSPATSPRPPTSCGARPRSATASSSSRASCPGTGRRPSCRRGTGRRGSTARGRWSSPGSPRRPRRRGWPSRRRA